MRDKMNHKGYFSHVFVQITLMNEEGRIIKNKEVMHGPDFAERVKAAREEINDLKWAKFGDAVGLVKTRKFGFSRYGELNRLAEKTR